MESTAQMTEEKTAILYDAGATQRVEYDVDDNGQELSMTQIFGPLDDKAILEYDRLREVLLEGGSDKQTDVKTNSVEADEYLFDALCTDILGFEGDKPENWKEEITLEEKQFGIGKLLGFKILDGEKAKASTGKRQWGKPLSKNTVELKCRFDGEIVICKAHFEDKRPGDVAMYATMRSRVSLIEQDLDESAIKIPAQMRRKSELFKKLNPQVEGYANGVVPVHHQAGFISAFFEPKISKTEKK